MRKTTVGSVSGVVAFVFLALLASPVFAVDTLGDVAETVSTSWQSVLDLMSGVAYLAGVIFGIRALILFKDNTDNPGQVRLSRPIMAFAVATLLLALPSTFSMLAETVGMLGSASEGKAFTNTLASGGAAATDADDLSEMAVAFGKSLPALKTLVQLAAVLMGAGLILRAIFLMPQLEQGRAEPSKVLWTLVAGVMLWSVLPMIEMALATLGSGEGHVTSAGEDNVLAYGYIEAGASDKFQNTMKAVLMFIQFIGLIAFVRGGLLLKQIGEHKDGAMGRAMTHIFGGAAAINITWAVWLLANTIGAGWICNPTNSADQTNPLAIMCKH